MKKITVDGKSYPARATMGALIAFKRERGMDISNIENDIEALCYFAYECVKSACRVDGVDFPYSFEEFADKTDLTELMGFQQQDGESTDKGNTSKKK
jgi:hypothetical protein